MKKPFSLTRWISLLVFVFVSCKSFKEPDFLRIEDVRVSRFGLIESSVNASLYYFNPNKSRLKLKHAEGDAWIEDTYLGHFTMDTLIRILPRSEFMLPVKLKMDMSNFTRNMSVAFLAGKEAKVKLEGKARVGKGGIYINYPIRYEGKLDLRELLK